MKNIISILTVLLIANFSCNKVEPLIVSDNPVKTIQDSISVFFKNDTIKFRFVKCPTGLISVAMRKDSFGINRSTIIPSEDTMACYVNVLQIGIDITDKIENYPVTKEVMKMHLDQMQSKTSTLSRFEVKFSDDCYTYQNFERIFNDSVQLYTYSKNDYFNYKIDNYSIIDGSSCGYNSSYFLIELEGSFNGVLYTSPNIINKDSIFVECPKFKTRILHSMNN